MPPPRETTCKNRLPNCNGYGSVCYDPRFVGGDGVIFYFHGAKGGDFLSSPTTACIDALAVSWDGQDIAIDPPSTDGEAEWQAEVTKEITEDKSQKTKIAVAVVVVIERTATTNSIRVSVNGMLAMDVKVVPITAEDDRKHGYRIPTGDAFAHLEMQFKFAGLTDKVEGILGQTYRPDYVSTAKKGAAMPMMGGEDR